MNYAFLFMAGENFRPGSHRFLHCPPGGEHRDPRRAQCRADARKRRWRGYRDYHAPICPNCRTLASRFCQLRFLTLNTEPSHDETELISLARTTKSLAVMVTIMFEVWSEGKAPPYSPMTTSLKPGTPDLLGISWSQYGGKTGIWRFYAHPRRHRNQSDSVLECQSRRTFS